MREFDWKTLSQSEPSKGLISKIRKTFNLSKSASQVMARRGLITHKDIHKYLHGEYKDLYDPFLFPDMLKAASRLIQAGERHEPVMIHGDYDCDGITGSAMIRRVCEDLKVPAEVFIPDRSMGYGLSKIAVSEAISRGVRVLITCDCGSNEHRPLAMARKAGIDVIVLDHHSFEKRPGVFAFLNPEEPYYPFDGLSGAGMALKFIQALAKLKGGIYPEDYLDLAAVATIADAVPLIDENRIIVKEGLKRLPSTSNLGMHYLLKASGLLGRKLDTEIIGFIVAPKINAPGRIDNPRKSLDLLLEIDSKKAEEQAHELVRINKQRREINSKIRDEAIEMVEKQYKNDRFLVLNNDSWHKGVIGIVASTMVEIYHKPTCIISGGYGSVRTVPEYALLKPLKACESLLERWGGHPMAAGLKVRKVNIKAFREKINEVSTELPVDPTPYMLYDSKLKVRDVGMRLVQELEMLEPFGQGNRVPHFVIEDMHIARSRVTTDGQHLQLTLRNRNNLRSAVGFWMAGSNDMFFDSAQKFDILFCLERGKYDNEQVMIKDMKEVKTDW